MQAFDQIVRPVSVSHSWQHCVQVQQRGMQALSSAYRQLQLSAAGQLLGMLHMQPKGSEVQVIGLLKVLAEAGNVQARRAYDEWQASDVTRLQFRA